MTIGPFSSWFFFYSATQPNNFSNFVTSSGIYPIGTSQRTITDGGSFSISSVEKDTHSSKIHPKNNVFFLLTVVRSYKLEKIKRLLNSHLWSKENYQQQQRQKSATSCQPEINVHPPRHCPCVAIFFCSNILLLGCFLHENSYSKELSMDALMWNIYLIKYLAKFIKIQTEGTATKFYETKKYPLKTLKEGACKYRSIYWRRHGWTKLKMIKRIAMVGFENLLA